MNMPIEDINITYLEHFMVIHNFVIKIGNQIKDSLCHVFGDSLQYQWQENNDKKSYQMYLSYVTCGIGKMYRLSLSLVLSWKSYPTLLKIMTETKRYRYTAK